MAATRTVLEGLAVNLSGGQKLPDGRGAPVSPLLVGALDTLANMAAEARGGRVDR